MKIQGKAIKRSELIEALKEDESFLVSKYLLQRMDGESVRSKPLVSVVIPTYNRPIYLRRCVESVLGQTYKNIEIIVVDDNNPGTDTRIETERLMEDYKGNDFVVYIQHERNKNGSAARNTGWRASQGEYITFLDDDDEIDPTKIEKQVACLQSLDKAWGASYTGYQLLKENGNNQISTEKRCGDCYIDALMRTMFMGSGSNLLLRKSVVDEVQGYDETFKRNQDIEFLARVLEKYKLAYVDEVLLTIYQEGNRREHTFEELESYTMHYIRRFTERISKLSPKDRKRVNAVISLERFRVALYKHRGADGMKILIKNRVSLIYILKYVKYLIHRFITHESYGFNGK